MKNIQNNIAILKQQVQYLLQKNNSLFKKIKIIAVSKNQSIEKIQTALSSGIYEFGENYIQESIYKIHKLKANKNIVWHFIGKLQSKKTKLVAQYFDWCQTIEREKIAFLLNQYREKKNVSINVLIQINISEEENKTELI